MVNARSVGKAPPLLVVHGMLLIFLFYDCAHRSKKDVKKPIGEMRERASWIEGNWEFVQLVGV